MQEKIERILQKDENWVDIQQQQQQYSDSFHEKIDSKSTFSYRYGPFDFHEDQMSWKFAQR